MQPRDTRSAWISSGGLATRLRDTRLAWIVWCLFAVAIAATTVVKHDQLLLNDAGATRLTGRIICADEQTVTFRVLKEDADRRVPRSEVALLAPLGDRSVTGNYRLGAERWRSTKPMYSGGVHGFLYMPQAAMLFVPFEVLPPYIGEVLWRWIGLAAYAAGVYLLCKRLFPAAVPAAFTLATFLAIPAALGSAQNGQTNLAMGGLFALAAVHVGEQRWRLAALWLTLALVCKPVALPVILLLAAARPRLLPALSVGLLIFLFAPFLHPDPSYVGSQYQASIHKVLLAADPSAEGAYFTDIRGMLRDFGLVLTDTQLLPVRALAALVFLGLTLSFAKPWTQRRALNPFCGSELELAFLITFLGVAYIMIFNPRTEGVTYAMIGPFAAMLATRSILDERWKLAAALVAYCLIVQFSMVITGGDTKYWLRPLATIALVVWVVFEAATRRAFSPSPDTAAAP